jgi:hypothetical protein
LKLTTTLVIALLLVAAIYVDLSHQSTAETKGSGPISTFPAAWLNPCRLPVLGNITTDNGVVTSSAPGLANFSLSQVYSRIVESEGFKEASGGDSWVTGSWSLIGSTVSGENIYNVQGTFIRLTGGQPDGYVIADYYNDNGNVTATRQTDLLSFGCPETPSSSTSIGLDKGTPAYYIKGQPVKVIFRVNNSYTASTSLSFSASSSCLGQFDVYGNVSKTYSAVYHSSEHGECGTSPLSVVLNSNESFTQVREWDQTYDNGTQVTAGIYRVEANMSDAGIGSLTDSGGEVYLGTPVSINSTDFGAMFVFTGHVHNSFISLGTPVKLDWILEHSGAEIYDIKTSQCSFNYKILNISNAVVYDSLNHVNCDGQLTDNPLPPQGLLSQTLFWNGTDDLGKSVTPGFYRAVLDLNVFSGGRQFNASEIANLLIGKPGHTPDHLISIHSSLFCTSGCAGSTPSLSAVVYANGNLKSLALYINGTYIGATQYTLPCCQFTYSVDFNVPLDNQKVRITAGASYDVVLVGTFSDGETSISWANPLNSLT